MDKDTPTFNDMQTVKRNFFAMRNGVIADVLRKGGSPFRIIFGLNLPQLVEIAEMTPHDRELSQRLWENSSTRESMLLAPMLMPRDSFSMEDAMRWISVIPAYEVADILCHRLLRFMPYSSELVYKLIVSDNEMGRYTGVRLACNLQYSMPELAKDVHSTMMGSEKDDAACRLAKSNLAQE